jgi:opacity protein-like surface antigen
MEIRRLIIAAFCLALTSTAAYSMHHEGTSAEASSGFYVGVDAGVALVAEGSDPFLGRALFGYSKEIFALELGYLESAHTTASAAIPGGVAFGSAKVRGGDLSLIVNPFTKYGFEHFYVRAGGHYSQLAVGATAFAWGASASFASNENGVGWLAGAGLDIPLSDAFSIQAGYTHYGAIAGVRDLKVNAITGGLRFNF